MKKTLTILFVILSGLLILDSLDFGHALILFLFLGIVPGTDIVLSAQQTLTLFSVLIGFVIGRIGASIILALSRQHASHRLARYSLPKAAAPAK